MIHQKNLNLCLVATLVLQIIFVSATPIETEEAEDSVNDLVQTQEDEQDVADLDTRGLFSWLSSKISPSSDGLTPGQKETEENIKKIKGKIPNAKFNTGNVANLATRGLFDLVSSPTSFISNGTKAVDDTVKGIGNAEARAVRNTAGLGVQRVTGVNPVAIMDMPREAMKTALHGVKYGTAVAFDTTDRALDTIQGLHDKKKQLINDYVKPYTPDQLSNGIDRVNEAFDSSMATIKDGMRSGRDMALEKLSEYEKRIEEGGNLLPSSLGIAEVGQSVQNGANALLGFYGFGGAGAAATDAAAEAGKSVRKSLLTPEVAALALNNPAPVSNPAPVANPPPVVNPPTVPASAPLRRRPTLLRFQRNFRRV